MEEKLTLDSVRGYDPVLQSVSDALHAVYDDVDWMFSGDEREMLFLDHPVSALESADIDGEEVELAQDVFFLVRIAGEVFVWTGNYHPVITDAKIHGDYFQRFRHFNLSRMLKIRMALKRSMRRIVMPDVEYENARYLVFGTSKKAVFHHYIDAFYGIVDERRRQVEEDGLTLKVAYDADEDYDLAKAAYCLAFDDIEKYADGVPRLWPYDDASWKRFAEGVPFEDRLTRAAAWLVAEMEKETDEYECTCRVMDGFYDIRKMVKAREGNDAALGRIRNALTRYADLDDDGEEKKDALMGDIGVLPNIVVDMIHVIGNLKKEHATRGKQS